jgi:hypothetical protein
MMKTQAAEIIKHVLFRTMLAVIRYLRKGH